MKVGVHVQLYPFTPSTQVPPFWQGFGWQSSIFVWQFDPTTKFIYTVHISEKTTDNVSDSLTCKCMTNSPNTVPFSIQIRIHRLQLFLKVYKILDYTNRIRLNIFITKYMYWVLRNIAMETLKISTIFPTCESSSTSTVIGVAEVVTGSSVQTRLTLTFVHVHCALCTCPARGTGTVVGIQLVPTDAPITTRLGWTLIVIDRAVFTCPSWGTVARIIVDLKQKVGP